MKKIVVFLSILGCLSSWSPAHAATIQGTVTRPDGTTALEGVKVNLYRFDPALGTFEYDAMTLTNATGKFTLTPYLPPSLGAYHVVFSSNTYTYLPLNPFSTWDYYENDPFAGYYTETYNDVTLLTPAKAPTQILITGESQVKSLGIVKLNPKTSGLLIVGPITINGVNYDYLNLWGYAPGLPSTGGTLNISFTVQNLGSTAVTTAVELFAYLSRVAPTALAGVQSTVKLAGKETVSVPANGNAVVSMSTTISAALMKNTVGSPYSSSHRFNVGIQGTSAGVANSFQMAIFPVMNSSVAADQTAESAPPPRYIPLRLSIDGKPLVWGPEPTTSK